MPKDNIVIDTNVLLDDPHILNKLKNEYKIIIPLTVLRELDNHKFDPNLSYSARNAIYSIINFKKEYPDNIKLDITDIDIDTNDDKIIQSAVNNNADIATKDLSMSVIADSKEVNTKLYDIIPNGFFNPYIELFSDEYLDYFTFLQEYQDKEYEKIIDLINKYSNYKLDINTWSFLFLKNSEDETKVIYANNPLEYKLLRIDNNPKYRSIENEKFNLKAKDYYQVCAIFVMKEAPNALICGSYGSGKSLLSTSYGLIHSDKKTYISRPNLTVDRRFELGFLPGKLEEKLEPWMSGFTSSLYYLFSNTKNQKSNKDNLEINYNFVKEKIFTENFEMAALETLQGTSFTDGDLLLLDEVQLCSVSVLSVVLSRFGEGSKLIMTGDLGQVYDIIRPSENGLLKLLRLLPNKNLAYVELKTNYRSKLVEIAALLQDKSF